MNQPPRTISAKLLLAVFFLLITFSQLAYSGPNPPIAWDMVGSSNQNLNSFTNNAPAFSSAGDCFGIIARPTGPFDVLDDSLTIFPADTQGIIKDANLDNFFCIVDTENGDNTGAVSAEWAFDVSGYDNLEVSVDVGAMGDFETADVWTIEASIDGGTSQLLLSNSVDEAGSQAYTMEGGAIVNLNDPMLLDGVLLNNNLQTFLKTVTGTGSELVITLTALSDGGGEAVALQNLIVSGSPAGPQIIAFDMVGSSNQNLNSFTNNAPAFSSAGDCFKITNRAGGPPFQVMDDSLSIFTTDSQGIIKEGNVDDFFCISDTENSDNSGPVSADWAFDVSGYSNLELSVDIGAMGDFEAADEFSIEVAIDGGTPQLLFSSTVNEAGSQAYTLEGGGVFNLDDPMLVDGIMLNNNLQTFLKAVTGSGSELVVTVTAETDGGSEAIALQNLVILGGGTSSSEPVINEFVANHTGTDSEAFIEVFAAASTDYSNLTLLEIEGDAPSSGIIDAAIPLTSTDANGFWVDDEDMENGTITILLVEGFTGAVNDDLDTNDDGVLDVTPWTRIVDDVAVFDGGASDRTYSSTVLNSTFGGGFTPGGASRIPNGVDTDTVGDWVLNDFDGFGFPGFPGSQAIGEAINTPGAVNAVVTVIQDPVGVCSDPATMIHDIQGSGLASTDIGSVREVEAVVVGVFQGAGYIGGYFLQEEDTDADGDPLTSEGLRIFDTTNTPAIGDVVRVRGSVLEFNGLTEMNNVTGFSVCGTGTATPADVTLPVTSVDDLERFEGMAVNFPQTLVISEYFNFDRFNEIVLTSTRHNSATADFDPGPDAIAANQAYLLDRITLDDGRSVQNPDPARHPDGNNFDLTNLFRGGDTLDGVAGVMDYSFGLYRIQPTQGATHTNVNVRTVAPDPVGGSLKVAAFNVLNYFTTLDYPTGNPLDNKCGPAANQECRGADADQPDEFTRQRDKIIAALVAIDADIVGLLEIENHPGDVPAADLVDGLNNVLGAGTYAYLATGAIGTDAIRVAIIYKPANATPVGPFAVLDSTVDARFDDTRNRPALAQTFRDNSTSGRFTVAVNHLKSKGSDCNAVGDPDLGDGAGNCNVTRDMAAAALVDWLASDPTGSGDADAMIIGDLNSYDMEDPIDTLKSGGYTDLADSFIGNSAYSYVFDGRTGYLDYAMANGSLLGQVTGTTIWHINADEPDLIDYDTSFKQAAQDAIYAPDAYRASDHDPVIAGLALVPVADLSISKVGSPDPVIAGADLTYTVSVSNAGPDDALDVVVTDNLPAGLTLVSTTGCAEDPNGVPTCSLGTIAAGADAQYTIVATVDPDLPDGTILSNTASVSSSSDDPDSGNNQSDPPTLINVISPTSRATFTVRKRFMDGNNVTPVTFRIDCNTGLILDQEKTVFPDQGEFDRGSFEVSFVVTNFTDGQLSCTVSEDPVGGYTASYVCGSSNDPDQVCSVGDDSPLDNFGVGPCFYENVDSTGLLESSNFCTIRNYPNPGQLAISKEWLVEGSVGEGLDMRAYIDVTSDGDITGGSSCNGNQSCASVYFAGPAAQTRTLEIASTFQGTDVWLVEDLFDLSFESENDCNGKVTVYPAGFEGGSGVAQCKFTNTAFFEGIPTLSQYGMLVMALLMLGVGLVGFRRYS